MIDQDHEPQPDVDARLKDEKIEREADAPHLFRADTIEGEPTDSCAACGEGPDAHPACVVHPDCRSGFAGCIMSFFKK